MFSVKEIQPHLGMISPPIRYISDEKSEDAAAMRFKMQRWCNYLRLHGAELKLLCQFFTD